MSFEPAKIVGNVLEFYYSAGIIKLQDNPVKIEKTTIPLLNEQQQKYEQLLFFLLGHLLPEFTPLTIDFRLQGESANTQLLTLFGLPPASTAALAQLNDAINSDERLKKLLSLAKAHCTDLPGVSVAYSCQLELSVPISVSIKDLSAPIIDFTELLERFDGDEVAFTLLEGFVMNARRHLSLLVNAVDKLDWNEAHRHSHALKGGALNICAEPFAAMA